MEETKVKGYDVFPLVASLNGTTPVGFALNGMNTPTGSLFTVATPANYTMRIKNGHITNSGTVTGTVNLIKTNGTNSYTIGSFSVPANSTIYLSNEVANYAIPEGYYLQATNSAGTGIFVLNAYFEKGSTLPY